MNKKTAFLALALFAGSTGFAMADPFVAANVRVAPGVHVAFGIGPKVIPAARRAPVVVRPVAAKKFVFANRYDRFRNHRVLHRGIRDYDRNRPEFNNHRNCL